MVAGRVIAQSLTNQNKSQTDLGKIQEIVENKITPLPPFPVGEYRVVEIPKPVVKVAYNKPVAVTDTEESALQWIISHEGGPTSVNPTSYACGLAQSLPCSKILLYAGVDTSLYNLETYDGVKAAISTVPAETQRAWMIQYCVKRYGSIVQAKQFWQSNGWY